MADDEVVPETIDDDAAAEPVAPPTTAARARAFAATYWKHAGAITLLVVVMFVVLVALQEEGHGWGDDFALYINQAKSMVKGDVGRVIADNRFAVENSSSTAFSPIAYPWGFPLLMVPLYFLFGLNYGAFKLLQITAFCGFLVFYYVILRRRCHPILAISITAVIAASPIFVRAVSSVNSDLPSLFFVGATLVWIEHCRDRGLLAGASSRALVGLGLLMGYAFSIRRETIALAAALASLHLVELWPRWRANRAAGETRERFVVPWPRLLTPYGVAAGFVLLLQIALPASLAVETPEGGIGKLGWHLSWYKNVIAESFGFKEFGASPVQINGSEFLGSFMLHLIAALLVVGVIGTLVVHKARDLHLVVFMVVTIYIIGSLPFHEGRYIYSLLPLIAYFASQATVLWDVNRGSSNTFGIGHGVAAGLVALSLFSTVPDLAHAVDYHLEYNYVLQGPETPSSQEMFAAVERCTRGDDVVMFSAARSMNLYTGRRAIQSGNLMIALQRPDWMVLANDDVNYWEPPINADNYTDYGLVRVWHNDEYSLYRLQGADPNPFTACPPEA